MILKEALLRGINILKSSKLQAPAVEAGAVLCFVLNCSKVFLYGHDDYVLKADEEQRFFECVDKRAKGIPLQYILGHQEFMSLDFSVNPSVLIPRQDTEILVEAVMRYAKGLRQDEFNILDIGTGSGCVAVSLVYYIRNSIVTAVDVSEKALQTARLNAVSNGVAGRLRFVQGSLFDGVAGSVFDIIVSNPPYIPTHDISGLQVEVKDFEPLTALDGGEDGLDFYRGITEGAVGFLKSGGLLAFEVGYNQSTVVREIMESRYYDILVIEDLAGIERVVMGRMK